MAKKTEKTEVAMTEKAQRILEKIKLYKITGYEIEKNTNITSGTFYNFFKGKTVPFETTLDVINDYIESYYEKSKIVKEERETYSTERSNKMVDILARIESKLDVLKLQNEIMFEILKNGKKVEIEYIEKQSKKRAL